MLRDLVRIKILPSWYLIPTNREKAVFGLCVEVINLGFVPVTISNAYFEARDGGIFADLHIRSTHGDQRLPVRLESRESTTLMFDSALRFDGAIEPPVGVLVKTACGIKKRSANKAFKQWIRTRTEEAEQAAT